MLLLLSLLLYYLNLHFRPINNEKTFLSRFRYLHTTCNLEVIIARFRTMVMFSNNNQNAQDKEDALIIHVEDVVS